MTDENSEAKGETDLLGDPVEMRNDHLGRSEFKKTEENQQFVCILRARKWSYERIAKSVGCDVKTLRKHFSRELESAADIIEAEALKTILQRNKDGNVTAANRMMSFAEEARALPPAEKPEEETATGPAEAPLGKKEKTLASAQNPPANWGKLLGSSQDRLN